MLTLLALTAGLFFAMNIGASGAAATMGVAYGSGAIKQKTTALLLCGIGILLGALFGGGEVVKTIGSGIVPESTLTVQVVIITIVSATISLFLANILGIPLSTSEITVGAVVGVGIAYQSLYFNHLYIIMIFWIIVPVIAFIFTFFAGKIIHFLEKKYPKIKGNNYQKWLTIVLIFAGFSEAFSAGMNNVANAVGPLVGAGLLSLSNGTILGGIFVALGAILFGRKVLETNGKKITSFSLLEGCVISITGASLIIGASLFGIPMPLTQVTTSSIIGIGSAQNGFYIWQKRIVIQMIKVWIVSPVFSLVISYSLIKLLLVGDIYSLVVLLSVCLATIGTISLVKTIREDKRSVHEHGGGI